MAEDEPNILRDDQAGRFVLADRPEAAYLDFEESEGQLVLLHTEVDGALEGRGIGGALVRAALDHAEDGDLTVVPRCGFVASWFERHPERVAELDVVTP